MVGATKSDAAVATYYLEVEIEATPDVVWTALTKHTNAWWLSDFHQVGPDSIVTLEARAGGRLVEETPDGGSLLWYTVQFIRPRERTLHLFGHVAPEWGGPATSCLKLAIESKGVDACILRVTDAHHGHVDDKNLASMEAGWTQLFTEGLKRFAEA